MKNWLNRLKTRPDAPDASTQPAPAAPSLDPADAGIDAAWYGWLTASAATEVPDDLMQRILDQVRTLARDPAASAQLVPRVPEVVPQLLRSLGDEDASSSELARQVAQDVVLVAEVIREANSAYYRPITPVKNAEAAIVMLGQNGLRMLLARIAFRPIVNMQAEGFAKRAAPRIWDQSVKCALAASLMAPGLTAGVFESYLAGLMQNVGLMVALRLADRTHPGSVPADPEFGAALLAASREISAGIAAHWEFPPDVAAAIARAGNPGDAVLAQALAQGDRIAKLRMLMDAHLIGEDDPMVADGLTSFQRRCLGKLENVET
ncbi:HDOD domain-containing protein [Massilia phyllosphaerae]|uniref:HDOD domain-containing protein n=1 Tax=Massilia phyllosphaerae TaxID=3106034 RepID=UPI002B1CC6B7|nr:HDOD domain-containing protein [Massilia sp. SGZ-792]